MKMIDISNKYKDKNKGKGYINISVLEDYIKELFINGYTVAVCELLQITKNKTQPYSDFSLYNEYGFTLQQLLEEIKCLKKRIIKSKMKTTEIFFAVGVLPKE